MVSLQNGHIVVSKNLVDQVLDNCDRAGWVYYANRNIMMLASSADDLFKSIHQSKISLFKHRNEQGDRSLSIQELLLDHEIDGKNRELKFRADEILKVLTIYL